MQNDVTLTPPQSQGPTVAPAPPSAPAPGGEMTLNLASPDDEEYTRAFKQNALRGEHPAPIFF